VKNRPGYSLLLISVFSLFIISLSCKRINSYTELGGGLIPAVDNITTFETYLDVVADNFELPDSTIITRSELHALGEIGDPVFGDSKGEIYFSITPPAYRYYPFTSNNPDSLKVDSVILSLSYGGTIYGDTNSVQNFQAFEIDQSAVFDTANAYTISNPDFTLAGSLSPVKTVYFNELNDSIQLIRNKDTTTVVNQIRIPFDNAIFSRFLAYDTASGQPFYSDSLFRTNFKGIAVKVNSGDKKAISYVNLSSSSGLIFYYRLTKNGVEDTTTTVFPVGNYTSNLLKRNNTGSEYAGKLSVPPLTGNKEQLYIQSSPGSFVALKIPALDTFKNALIHRAELQFTALPSQMDSVFTKPGLLFLDVIDSVNSLYKTVAGDLVYDYTANSYNSGNFGGYFTGDKCSFNLTRYMQSVITRKDTNYTFRLYAPYYTASKIGNFDGYASNPYGILFVNSYIGAGRVVITGGAFTDPTKRMRLRVVYSKI